MYEFKKLNESIYYVLGNKSEPCPKLSLVVGKDFSLLVDVGNKEEHVKILFNGIKEYNLPPIKYVVITHFHDDHLHNINYFKDYIVIASKQTSKYIKFPVNLFTEKLTLNLGEEEVTIDQLPNSHAKGSLLIYLNKEKVMFIGDALAGKILDDSYTINRSLTYELIKKIKEYDVATFIDGHGDIIMNNKDLVYQFLENYNKILKENVGDNVEIKEDF